MSRPIHKAYDDPTADVALVSADNVVFLTHKVPLMGASDVFRTIIRQAEATSTCQAKHVYIPEIDLYQQSDVVEAFLSILHGRNFRTSVTTEITLWDRCLHMAYDYQCAQVARTVLARLFQLAISTSPKRVPDPFSLFVVAAKHEALDVCAALIGGPHGDDEYAVDPAKAPTTAKRFKLDPSAGAIGSYERVPQPYGWCLLKVMSIRRDSPVEHDRKWAAREFLSMFDEEIEKEQRRLEARRLSVWRD